MPRKILLTCEDYFPHVGGAEVCVYNLKKQLERMEYAVTLYTNTTQQTDEAHVVRIPWRFRPLALLKNVMTLWKLIGSHDLVHCQYSFRLACICAPIAKLRGKPLLLTQQGKGIVPEENPRFVDSLFVKICQNVSMRGAALLTATGDEILDLTAAFVERKRITMISNGYDRERFSPNPSLPIPVEFLSVAPGWKKILSVRRLTPKNGIHIFIQALGQVKERSPHFHYFAIGEGRVEEFIRTLIQEFGLEHHVTLLGKKSNDRIAEYYQHTDLVVIPSSAEARSIACIEAMGMGKPVIASRVGGLIDLLEKDGDFGTLVKIYDGEECTYEPPERLPPERLKPLADTLVSFIEHSKPFEEKAARARVFVEKNYSWETITRQYVGLYEKLIAR